MVRPVRLNTPIAPLWCFWRLFCTALTTRPTAAPSDAALKALPTGDRTWNTGSSSADIDDGLTTERPQKGNSENIIPQLCDPCVRPSSSMGAALAQFVSVTGASSDTAQYVA